MKKNSLGNQLLQIILVFLILSLLSGCWDARELGSLAIVAAVGIDLADKSGKLLITIQIIKPGEVKSGGGGGEGGGGIEQKKGGKQQAFLVSKYRQNSCGSFPKFCLSVKPGIVFS